MANIDDFKANLLGGGARANQFRVTVTPPPGIAIGLDVRRASFLCRASNLPALSIAEIAAVSVRPPSKYWLRYISCQRAPRAIGSFPIKNSR